MVVDRQLPHGSHGNYYNVGLMDPFLSGQNKPRFIRKVRKNSGKGVVSREEWHLLGLPQWGLWILWREQSGDWVVFIGIGCF